MPQGFEPEVKKYLRKILYSIFYGLLWMSLNVLTGLFWEFAIINGRISTANILFYLFFLLSLAALLYYYYRVWNENKN
ncbi:MAG: hypothetical protein C4308_06240 [Chitinophagaceae bacterium]